VIDMTQKFQPGDRVRLTLEGVVHRHSVADDGGALSLVLDGSAGPNFTTTLVAGELVAPTFKVEVLKQHIEPGDWVRSVRIPTQMAYTGPVLAIHGDYAWIGDSQDTGVIRRVDTLTRVADPRV
jgi:hypothetical protein